MPVIKPTDHHGRITWLGRVGDRAAGLASAGASGIMARFSGVEGEAHSGLTRASCSRVTGQYKRGTEISNVRQISVVSAEELEAIAQALGLDRVAPELLGATMVIAGIPDFTRVPPSSRLIFESGAGLVVDMENAPCNLTAKALDAAHPGTGRGFRSAAKGRRGVTAWVEAEGPLSLGMVARLHVPTQPPWPHG